jgi:hypothetical protein
MRTVDSRWRLALQFRGDAGLPVKISDAARQKSRAAVIGHYVRYVLQISMLAVIVLFAAAYVMIKS